MKPIETKRLLLDKANINDAPFIYELLNSPGWLKYIGDRGVRTIEDAEKYLKEKVLPDYDKQGAVAFAIRLKSTGVAIGMCGLYEREGLDDLDIGFAFLPEYGGKGYAFEAAKEVLDYGKNHLKVKKVVAITLPINQKSINLLEKIGLSFEKRIAIPNDPEELSLYEIIF